MNFLRKASELSSGLNNYSRFTERLCRTLTYSVSMLSEEDKERVLEYYEKGKRRPEDYINQRG